MSLAAPSTVFDRVDTETRAAIIQLNQKLVDLKSEIALKLKALETAQDAEHVTQKQHLTLLANEIERALESIDEVVNMVVSEELTHSEFIKLHHDDLEKFREMVSMNADKIAKINEKLG